MTYPAAAAAEPGVFIGKYAEYGDSYNRYNQKDTQDYEYLFFHYFVSIFTISIFVSFCLWPVLTL